MEKKKRVKMLRGGGGRGTGAGALANLLVKNIPQFSGEISAWSDFVSRWNRYISNVQGIETGGNDLPDDIKVTLLLQTMDADNHSILQAKVDKGLGFQELWGDLEKRFEIDTVEYYRNKLEALEMPLGGRNEDAIRKFKAEWEKLRARIIDMGSEEEYEKLYKKLDAGQRFELAKEENKLKKDKKAVKINRFGDHTMAAMTAFLTRVVGTPQQNYLRRVVGTL